MAPRRPQEGDSSDESSEESTVPTIARKGKFDDEDDDSDVLDSWDAAEDSETQREKAKKVEIEKQKAEAAASAAKKSKSQRREAKIREHKHKEASASDNSSEDESSANARARARQREQAADLKHAENLIGDIGLRSSRSDVKSVIIVSDQTDGPAIDLATLPLFDPKTKDQFEKLRQTICSLLLMNSRKAHYLSFTQDLTKELVRDMPSDQVKKVASGLTTLSNERLKDEKAADKGGKKTKAAKTKMTLVASRDAGSKADTTSYADLDDDDFM